MAGKKCSADTVLGECMYYNEPNCIRSLLWPILRQDRKIDVGGFSVSMARPGCKPSAAL
jgi:hypothetical protein